MKRYSSFFFVLGLFGSLHAYWAISKYGFQQVDLPPIQFFLFTLWSCVRDILTFTLLLAAPVFLFGRFARWVVTLAWAYIVILICSCAYVSKVYHTDLASIWIELAMNTSVKEVMEFLMMSLTFRAVVGLTLIGFLVLIPFFVLRRLPSITFSRRSVLIGVGLICPFAVFNVLLMNNWHWGVGQMPYTEFVFSSVASYLRNRGFVQAVENKGLMVEVRAKIPGSELPNIVIVLGEYATRSNWHLYGYERHTTPRMDEECALGNCVALTDVVGVVPDTVYALSYLMTDVVFEDLTKGHWTLAEVMRRAGYQTVAIKNQPAGTTSLLAKIFNGCEKTIGVFQGWGEKYKFDEELNPPLEDELSGAEPKAVFVHLAGMHYPVRNACPPSEKHFTDSVDGEVLEGLSAFNRDRRNRYDDGIRYEDKVLGMFVDTLKKCDRPSLMFFISDHGESPRSDGWRNFVDKDVYELPCVVWMSDQYRKRFPETALALSASCDKPLQPDLMTGGLLDLAQIDPTQLGLVSFLNSEFKCRFPRKVNKGRIDYETTFKQR